MKLDECVSNCVYKCKTVNSMNDCSVDVDKLGELVYKVKIVC